MISNINRGFFAIAVCLALAALIAVGCGGDGEAASTDAPLTKAEFIKKGDAFCEKAEKKFPAELRAFGQERKVTGSLTKAQGEEAVQTVLIPSLQAQADQLEQLGAPSGDEDQVEAIVGGLQKVLAKGEEDSSEIGARPLSAIAKLAKEYGFEVCLKNF